jgi:hypothetical protein
MLPPPFKYSILEEHWILTIVTLDTNYSKVLAGKKFVSSNHFTLQKVFSDAIEMIHTKKD